jgi:hypothetical protein
LALRPPKVKKVFKPYIHEKTLLAALDVGAKK